MSADLVVLVGARPDGSELYRAVTDPADWVRARGVDDAAQCVLGGAAWLLAAWIAVGLIGLVGASARGTFGSRCSQFGSWALPAALVRTLTAAAGMSIALNPAAAFASPSAGSPSAGSPSAGSATADLARTDQHTPRLAAPAVPASSATLPTPAMPVSPAVPAARVGSEPKPVLPVTTVRVRSGDSLWAIAASAAPAPVEARAVAVLWPQWFAANRTVIGPDPGHLEPGAVLTAPSQRKGATR